MMKTKLTTIATLAILTSFASARPKGGERMKEADTDGDGNISLEEFVAQATARFEKMDADGDGQLTEEEVQEAGEKMRDRMKGNRRERRKERRGKRKERREQ